MEKRFEILEKEGFLEGTRIIVDTETGVQYLYVYSGYGGGVTPLLWFMTLYRRQESRPSPWKRNTKKKKKREREREKAV